MTKPLKTVENLLAAVYLAGTENGLGRSITDHKEIVHRREAFIKANPVCKEAKADLYQLMLSLLPSQSKYKTVDSYKKAIRQKLSEHFNGEGEV